jgi:hypothetical protein
MIPSSAMQRLNSDLAASSVSNSSSYTVDVPSLSTTSSTHFEPSEREIRTSTLKPLSEYGPLRGEVMIFGSAIGAPCLHLAKATWRTSTGHHLGALLATRARRGWE